MSQPSLTQQNRVLRQKLVFNLIIYLFFHISLTYHGVIDINCIRSYEIPYLYKGIIGACF